MINKLLLLHYLILAPNIFLCLHKGLYTLIILLMPFFTLIRKILFIKLYSCIDFPEIECTTYFINLFFIRALKEIKVIEVARGGLATLLLSPVIKKISVKGIHFDMEISKNEKKTF